MTDKIKDSQNTDEVKYPLISMLKDKYGISSVSKSIKISAKDDLYDIYRKTADFIWKNGTWSVDDYKQAIKDQLSYATALNDDADYYNVQYVKELSDDDPNVKTIRSAMRSSNKKQDFKIFSFMAKKENPVNGIKPSPNPFVDNSICKGFFAIDMNNASGTMHNTSYCLRSDRNFKWIVGNANRMLGYNKLAVDITKSFTEDFLTTDSFAESPTMGSQNSVVSLSMYLHAVLQVLSTARYKKHWKWMAYRCIYHKLDEMETTVERNGSSIEVSTNLSILETIGGWSYQDFMRYTEPSESDDDNDQSRIYRMFDDVSMSMSTRILPFQWLLLRFAYQLLKYIEDYLQQTYSIVKLQKYEREVDHQSRTPVFLEKKNINETTRQIMKSTKLNSFFSSVELDNDVDLNLFNSFESEAMRLMELLPKPDHKAVLRLRKLGNFRASGLFVPFTNTLIVDFRTPDQIYSAVKNDLSFHRVGKAGYSSFVHEYGHYLDYNLDQNIHALSMSKQFSSIVRSYRNEVMNHADDFPKSGKYSIDYFCTPTEVFARSFEIFVKYIGLRSNLIGVKDEYDFSSGSVEYRCFTPEIREMLFSYFNSIDSFSRLNGKLNVDLTVLMKKDNLLNESDNDNNNAESDLQNVENLMLAGSHKSDLQEKDKSESELNLDSENTDQSMKSKLGDVNEPVLVEHKVNSGLTEYLLF
ncbi:hypothetical protein ACLUWZ_09215 [Limosilactobacillus mucosae]|uniref:hypothetical protein n=1 Tax=Limosilactobacillus mucosae TaxID=97478 RepID=UPI0039911A5B